MYIRFPMITWDEPKRLANIDKHGFDFADLTPEFFASALIIPAKDRRLKAIGMFEDGTVAVIFFRLGTQGLSVISMRTAGKKEKELVKWQS